MDRKKLSVLTPVLFCAAGCGHAQPPAPVAVNFTQTDFLASEPDGTIIITVRLDAPAKKELRIPLRFGGTAGLDRDYEAPAEIVFAPGRQDTSLEFRLRGDKEAECTETASIELANSSGADRRATITIRDAESSARRLRVGGDGLYSGVAAAAQAAQDGDVIEIAEGDYPGDVAVLRAHDLVICAQGKGARIDAAGKAVEGKGTWVIKGDRVRVENIHFSGAKVPDLNGAGIRVEGRDVAVRHCRFTGNENGILSGEQPDSTITIENSEFTRNGAGDGYSHNIYIGKAGRLNARFNIFHAANIGHNVKTRARESRIEYNLITNGRDGNASMEVDFSIGGLGVLLGNVIQQSQQAENSALVSFGAEGFPYERNALLMAYNTFVNDRSFGVFMRAPADRDCRGANNVIAGRGEFQCKGWAAADNVEMKSGFYNRTGFDYRIVAGSAAVNAAKPVDAPPDVDLTPRYEIDPDGWIRKRVTRGAADAGAYEAVE